MSDRLDAIAGVAHPPANKPVGVVVLTHGAAVFTHGTADPFGSIAELRTAAGLITAPTEIIEITGARHDLASKTLDVAALAVDAALRCSVIDSGTGDGGSGTVEI